MVLYSIKSLLFSRSLNQRALLFLLFLCFFNSNNASGEINKTERIIIEVEPFKQIYNSAFFSNLCMITSDGCIHNISGFDFEWGFHYELEVDKINIEFPQADSYSIKYELVRIIEKEKETVDLQFYNMVKLNRSLSSSEFIPAFEFTQNDTAIYFNEVNVLINDKDLVEILKANSSGYYRILFEVLDKKHLQLLSIRKVE